MLKDSLQIVKPQEYLYTLNNVYKYYHMHGQNFSADTRMVTAVDNVSCDIMANEIFGIVGESGSGKSTLIRLIVGAERPSAGSILYSDNDIAHANKIQRAFYQSRVKMIFQDPGRSLNHRLYVEDILVGSLWYSPSFQEECDRIGIKNKKAKRQEALDRITRTLNLVDLDKNVLGRYPTEFSGGQRQRLAIARALIHQPEVLICDEITSALDASTRRNIIDLLVSFKKEHNITIIFVTHDLSLLLYLCDRAMVMSKGNVVEQGIASEVLHNPKHKETKRLIEAIPKFPQQKPKDRKKKI